MPLAPQSWSAGERWRVALVAALALAVAACVFLSRGWGIGQDSRLMHYIVLLMRHGFAPYRDIVDMNLPVTYMVEWAGMALFGWGDAAWRCFDLFELLVGCLAAAYLARPRGWFASAVAALLAALAHFSGGAFDMGQRDYSMAVLMLAGTAALFFALRRQRPWAMLLFAACWGFAAGIKPMPAPLAPALLVAALLHLRACRQKRGAYMAWALAGVALPALAVGAFLYHYRAAHAFFAVALPLARYHRGNGNLPLSVLALHWLPRSFASLFGLTAAVWIAKTRKRTADWEDHVLAAVVVCGIAGYLFQAKGWSYQAAPALLFLAVLAARLFAVQRSRLRAALFAAGCLLPAVYVPAQLARHPHHDPDAVETALMGDLQTVAAQNSGGVAALSGHIQCLDWNAGCLGALYRLRLLPVAGDIFDFWLFPARPAPITAQLQQEFLAKMQAAPPRVLVLTAHDWAAQQGFAKLDRWPQFATWLATNYSLALERHAWTTENRRPVDRGYRIYILR